MFPSPPRVLVYKLACAWSLFLVFVWLMNAAEQEQLSKRAANAFARGFLNVAIAGLGQKPEEASKNYKVANVVHRKYGQIATSILENQKPATA